MCSRKMRAVMLVLHLDDIIALRRPVTMEAPMPVRDQSPFGVAVLLIDSDD